MVEGIFRPRFQPPMRLPIESFGTLNIPRGTDFAWFVGMHYFDASGRELTINDVIAVLNRQSQLGPNLAAQA